MITGAALCPSPPLLCPELTGGRAVAPELRAACGEAVGRLLREDPEVVVIIGPAAASGRWFGAGRLNPSIFAPAIASTGSDSPPLAIGLGSMLLDHAGYGGRRSLQAVGHDEAASVCVKLGAELDDPSIRMALLVIGDGSARRSLKAPGYLDPRAEAFDAECERAIRTGDLGALQRLDQTLARDLMATGWPAWQVLSGALASLNPVAEVLFSGAPFGVGYLVAYLNPGSLSAPARCLSRTVSRRTTALMPIKMKRNKAAAIMNRIAGSRP
jgi:hypothetical protein